MRRLLAQSLMAALVNRVSLAEALLLGKECRRRRICTESPYYYYSCTDMFCCFFNSRTLIEWCSFHCPPTHTHTHTHQCGRARTRTRTHAPSRVPSSQYSKRATVNILTAARNFDDVIVQRPNSVTGMAFNLLNNMMPISGFNQWYPFGTGEFYQKNDTASRFRFRLYEQEWGMK